MLINNYKKESREKRHRSLRKRIEGTAERPRLAIFRSSRHIYAQVINDLENKTLVGTSDLGLEGAKVESQTRAARRPRPRRSARRSPRSASKKGSTRSCSTGPASSTTDASRRWQRARAKRA